MAARAVFLRAVLSADWNDHLDDAIAAALDTLNEVLDQLELAEPGIHAQLATDMDRAVADLRADLRLYLLRCGRRVLPAPVRDYLRDRRQVIDDVYLQPTRLAVQQDVETDVRGDPRPGPSSVTDNRDDRARGTKVVILGELGHRPPVALTRHR